MSEEVLVGKVKWFDDDIGYGFITHVDGRDVFVHYSCIEGDGYKTLSPGEEVQYAVKDGPRGLHASLVVKPGTTNEMQIPETRESTEQAMANGAQSI